MSGWWGTALAFVLVIATLAESMPLDVPVRALPTACDDEALVAARAQGIRAIAEQPSRALKDHEKTIARHRASTCGIATTLGPAGYQPFLSQAIAERVAALPDPYALSSLAALGLDHVLLRTMEPGVFVERRLRALETVTALSSRQGPNAVIQLKNPEIAILRSGATGRVLPIDSVTCVPATECGRLNDGDHSERWTTAHKPAVGDVVVASFAKARVTGLRWHHHGFATDLPLGLGLEAREADGSWSSWVEGAVDVTPLGREAKRPVLQLALPPRETTAIRITPLGTHVRTWWSGTELEIVAAE